MALPTRMARLGIGSAFTRQAHARRRRPHTLDYLCLAATARIRSKSKPASVPRRKKAFHPCPCVVAIASNHIMGDSVQR